MHIAEKNNSQAIRAQAENNSQSPSITNASDYCAECGQWNPPKKGKGSNFVNWIKCDKHLYWYHVTCATN